MINRNTIPNISVPGKPAFNPAKRVHLSNGVPVYLMNSGTEEVTKLELVFEAGVYQEDTPLQAALTNAMLQEGTSSFREGQIAEVFDFHGAYIQLVADFHFGVISIISLNKHLPKILPIVEEMVKSSVFPESEFQTLIKRRKQRFLLENEKVKIRCQKKFSEVLYGEAHPYSQTVVADDFDRVQKESLKLFYRQNYTSDHCRVVASGKLDNNLLSLLEKHFGQANWNGSLKATEERKSQSSSEQVHFVEKADAIQSAIRVGKVVPTKDHPDFAGLLFLSSILGGYFSSRLMANIREDKGYTYGIGSSIPSFRDSSYFVISTETDKQYEEATIAEVFKEIELIKQKPVGDNELDRVRQYLLGEFIRDFDGPFARSSAFRNVNDFGLDYSFYEGYYNTLLTISSATIQELANKYFEEDSFYTVVSGRK